VANGEWVGWGGVGPLNPPHVGDFNLWRVEWVVMVATPVIWVGRGLGGVVWGPGCLAVKCRYLYGPIEGGGSCHIGEGGETIRGAAGAIVVRREVWYGEG